MKMVMRYTYTVELSDSEFEDMAAIYIEEVKDANLEDTLETMSAEEFRREVVDYIVTSSHVGNYNKFVTNIVMDVLEDED